MKKTILIGIFALFVTGFASAQDINVLPQEARDFVEQHFSTETIDKVEEEDSWFSWDKNEMYEVYFANGIRVDFNKEGEPTEVTTREGAVIPEEVFPAAIRTYIGSNYPNAQIVSWEKDDDKQEIELDDDREIEFDLDGNFLKED